MRAYIICLGLAVAVTVAAFACVDWCQENSPRPVAYVEQLTRWIGGLE